MTLKEAIHILLEEKNLDDFVYTVRDRASQMNDGFQGNSWNHPRVTRFSEAIECLRTWGKDNE